MTRTTIDTPSIWGAAALIVFTAMMGLADAWLVAWWIGSAWGLGVVAGAMVGLMLSVAWALRRYLPAVSIALLVTSAAMTILLARSSPSAGLSSVFVALGTWGIWFLAYDVWFTGRANREFVRFTLPDSPATRRVQVGAVEPIRKAVFPAAGLGTRFLPATKAQPKEMLPLVDKPIIQYGVEEAVASGISHIIIVTGRGKDAIEDHFDASVELEAFLEARGKIDLLSEIRKIPQVSIAYVRQGEPLGLGHAVLAARAFVGDEPFAVVLADDVIDASPPALRQMIDAFRRAQGPVIAVERVSAAEISQYGVIGVDPGVQLADGLYRVRDLVEKPAREEAPSDLAIVGRYILTPDIFGLLTTTAPNHTGEIQLTDALRSLLPHRPVYAYEFKGIRHDTGNKLGFLRAVVYFALRHPELAEPFAQYLRSLDLHPASRSGRGKDHPLVHVSGPA